ncbi:unnamed protein product [Microthlaspi erraticum]|uniref:Uncharacterized protein n=1 Tax=Microthlaspi erraticum TaxID=1685480 RepID=A0A6D2JT40_9BRAS|nr:unnamed protein product [Microthlaspi erraticum]
MPKAKTPKAKSLKAVPNDEIPAIFYPPRKKTSSPPSDSLVSQLTAIRAIPVDVKTSSSSIKDQVGTAKKDEVKEDLLQIRSGPRSPGSLAARGEIRGGGS